MSQKIIVNDAHPHNHTLRTLIAIGMGNALDWYDWNVYAIFAPVFGTQFFPGDRVTAILSSFLVFAVGFLFRPIGAVIIGRFSDKHGRKNSMLISIIISGFGLISIACIPSVYQIGIIAPILVFIIRAIQGIAHGGELPTAQTYVAEKAPENRRGLWSSWIYVSGTIGNITGTIMYLFLAATLQHDQLYAYGWRLAFAFGGLCAILSFFARRKLSETQDFVADHAANLNHPEHTMSEYIRPMVVVFAVTVGFTVFYYAWAVGAQSYAQGTLQLSAIQATTATLIAQLIFIMCLPCFGYIADKIGYRKIFMSGFIFSIIAVFPLTYELTLATRNPWRFFFCIVCALVVIAMICSVIPIFFADMFPTGNRTRGVAIPYSLAAGIFGGTAPYVAMKSTQSHCEWFFSCYACGLLVLGLISVVCIKVKNYHLLRSS